MEPDGTAQMGGITHPAVDSALLGSKESEFGFGAPQNKRPIRACNRRSVLAGARRTADRVCLIFLVRIRIHAVENDALEI